MKPNATRWLVVDDEAVALEWHAAVLGAAPGAEVVACDSPARALEVFFAAPESFALLVTDFQMPGLDGLRLARVLRARTPALKVLMVTGSDLAQAAAAPGEIHALLPKPGSPAGLMAAVRRVLSGDRGAA